MKPNETYERLASRIFYYQTSAPYIFPTILDMAGDLRKKRILDVGCARGVFINELSRSCEPFGLDVSKNFLKQGRDVYGKMNVVCADAHAIPFEDKCFDCIFCLDVFEHLKNNDWVLAEFHRVLKDDGLLFLSVPNHWNILLLFLGMFGNVKMSQQEIEHAMTYTRMKKLLSGKFGIEEFRGGGYPFYIPTGTGLANYLPQFIQQLLKQRVKRKYRVGKPSLLGRMRIFKYLGFNIFFRCRKVKQHHK